MTTGPHMDRAEAKAFLRWRYGDQPAQVVYGDEWKAEEVAPEGIDALLDRVGDRRFYFAPCALRPSWRPRFTLTSGPSRAKMTLPKR